MSMEFQNAGKDGPADQLPVKSSWNLFNDKISLGGRPRTTSRIPRPVFYGIILGAAASLLMLARMKPSTPEDMSWKAAKEFTYNATWVDDQRREKSEIAIGELSDHRFLMNFSSRANYGVFAGDAESGFALGSNDVTAEGGSLSIPLSFRAEELGQADRICVVAGENKESFERAAVLVPDVWKLLDPSQCARIAR